MVTVEELKDQTNELLSTIQQYFSECSQNELIAWGASGLGVVLILVGLIMLF